MRSLLSLESMGQFLRGPNWASTFEVQVGMSRGPGGHVVASCALDVAAVRQHVRARDGVRLLLDVAARTMNVPMVCTARSVLMKSREDAGEGLTRDVLLLMHKERDVRTTARCASGAGDEKLLLLDGTARRRSVVPECAPGCSAVLVVLLLARKSEMPVAVVCTRAASRG